jgi:hypothetical protein
VRRGLKQFINRTGVDEIIVASAIYDHSARLRSYALLSEQQMMTIDDNAELPRSIR